MSASVIGSGVLRSGQPVCVATERTHNAVYVFGGGAWNRLVRWAGHEVTAACVCGDVIVCAALDDVVYLVQETAVSRVALPKKSDWIYGAAALDDESALLGGAGGLFVVSVKDRTVTPRRLSEFNISKPGRHVLNVVRVGPRTLVLGKKNLLVEYRGTSAVELINSKAVAGKELFFRHATELGNDLWLSGTGPQPFLARLEGEGVRYEDMPLTGQSSPVVDALGGELVLGGDRLLAGKAGQWRDLLGAPLPSGNVVAFVSAASPLPTCAVTNNGHSYFTDGHSCRGIPVF
jgi:hypothetical protein